MNSMVIVLVTAILVGVSAAVAWALAGAVLFQQVWPGHTALTDEVFVITVVAALLGVALTWIRNLLSGW